MDDALKARFKQFADGWNDDDKVHEGGLTGADLKCISKALTETVIVDLKCAGAEHAPESR